MYSTSATKTLPPLEIAGDRMVQTHPWCRRNDPGESSLQPNAGEDGSGMGDPEPEPMRDEPAPEALHNDAAVSEVGSCWGGVITGGFSHCTPGLTSKSTSIR